MRKYILSFACPADRLIGARNAFIRLMIRGTTLMIERQTGGTIESWGSFTVRLVVKDDGKPGVHCTIMNQLLYTADLYCARITSMTAEE